MCVTWLIHVCDMTHSYVWHDSFTCASWQNPAPMPSIKCLESTVKRALHFPKKALHSPKRSLHLPKVPYILSKSPTSCQKTSIFSQKSPTFSQKSPTFSRKIPNRSLHLHKVHHKWEHSLCVSNPQSKEPCILAKEPYILPKEPYISLKCITNEGTHTMRLGIHTHSVK